jgi:hypothetical protein
LGVYEAILPNLDRFSAYLANPPLDIVDEP